MNREREALLQRRTGRYFPVVSWVLPHTRGARLALTIAIIGSLGVLFSQAFLPLTVEHLLKEGKWDARLAVELVLLALLQLFASLLSHRAGHHVANEAGTSLRRAVFRKLLRTPFLKQQGLARASIVSRHTADVDRVCDAFEATLIEGIPAVIRIVQSLIILSFLEWRTGLAMTVASIVFLIVRTGIGRSLLTIDRQRLDASSTVGELVDETITSSPSIAGSHLANWQGQRFSNAVGTLRQLTDRQGAKIAQLVAGANAAGLVGLVVVVSGALIRGGENLAAVAASLLYVEGVVKGLETLPSWIRGVQQGVVSQIRIDTILQSPERLTPSPTTSSSAGLSLVDLAAQFDSGETVRNINLVLPQVPVIGLVCTTRVDPDYLCALLSGDANPTAGAIALDGHDVRHDSVKERIWSVPANSSSFNDSIGEIFRGIHPVISDSEILSALSRFGLAHLPQLTTGLDMPLGPGGEQLTRNERQRLALAVVLLARPEYITVGPILALADADTGLPLLQLLKESVTSTAIVSINTAELAEATDAVLFIDTDGVHLTTHRELLMTSANYAHHWAQRLATDEVDLSVLGIPDGDERTLLTRLVTESYSPGEVIYRQGDPADRIVFTIAGRVEIVGTNAQGDERRLAVLGPGNHCGDLRLAPGEQRAETVRALDDVVVRSLSREAISAGMTGLLDRTTAERQVVATLLRHGPTALSDLAPLMPALTDDQITQALALLERDGAVTQDSGKLRAVQKRRSRTGAADLLDRLTDL